MNIGLLLFIYYRLHALKKLRVCIERESKSERESDRGERERDVEGEREGKGEREREGGREMS